jgi:hypothetical protein
MMSDARSVTIVKLGGSLALARATGRLAALRAPGVQDSRGGAGAAVPTPYAWPRGQGFDDACAHRLALP